MTKRLRSRLVTSLSVLCAAALMTACSATGTGDKGGSDVTSLEMWLPSPLGSLSTDAEKTAYETLLEPFEKEHDVAVNLTMIPWDSYEEKYLTGVSSGQGPDIGYMYTEMMGDYIKNGAIVPFDEYLDSEAAGKMLYLENGKIDGKQYAMPWVVGGMRVLWGNMDVLEAAGVSEMPTTWAEFTDAAEKVEASGKIGIQQQWGDPARGMLNSTFFPLLWQAGGDIFNKEGTATAFNSEAGLEAANVIKGLLDSGAMPDTVTGLVEQDVKEAFNAGKVGFMNGVDNNRLEIEEAGINAEFVASLEGKQKGTFVASDALVMLDKCPDKQLCTDLTQFMLTGDTMTKFHADVVDYPPVSSDEAVRDDNPFFAVYVGEADMLKSLPIVPGAAEAYNTLYENMQQMVLGQKTPEQALADAAEAGDAALKNN
ncbi:ABC transporter substrate-binding protein [Tessaracoccus sp.]